MSLITSEQKYSLQSDFHTIIQLQDAVFRINTDFAENTHKLKDTYDIFVKQHSTKIHLLCLESFYFQYKTLLVEGDNIRRYMIMLNNQIYGDYYKLYHLILSQTSSHCREINEMMNSDEKYESYRDVEPFYIYPQSNLIDLHEDLVRAIEVLHIQYVSKENTIAQYKKDTCEGMSIGNFMETLRYDNRLFQEQIVLYVSYISFFHTNHQTYLAKLHKRILIIVQDICENILAQKTTILSANILLQQDKTIVTEEEPVVVVVKEEEHVVVVTEEAPMVVVKEEEPVVVVTEEAPMVVVKEEEPVVVVTEEAPVVVVKEEEPVVVVTEEEPVVVVTEEAHMVVVKEEEPVVVVKEEVISPKLV
jgi:hypothetical protein